MTFPRWLLLWLTSTLCSGAQEGSPALYAVSNLRQVKVLHTTVVRVPRGAEILRVYHGIPSPAAWAGAGFRAEGVKLTPTTATVNQDPAHGPSWFWEFRPPLFSEQTFESTFALSTADRRLRTGRLKLRWSDLSPPPAGAPTEPPPNGVAALAQEVRDEAGPLQSIAALADWTRRFSTYDASVPHLATDVGQTLLVGRGQCGHHAQLFASVMKLWGIPCRIVSGFRLAPTSEMWTPQNDWNRHVWVEVQLPGVGWAEVEPRTSTDPFFQPAELVRNSGMQSQASWISVDGKWSRLETYEDRIVAK